MPYSDKYLSFNSSEFIILPLCPRAILPLSQYTKVWWTASFQSIMNFIELRDEKTSQVEIQEYARALKEIMLEVYPETTKLWEEVYWNDKK